MSQFPPPPGPDDLSGEPQVPPAGSPYLQYPGPPQPFGFQPLQPPPYKKRQHWKWIVPVCLVAALAAAGLVWLFVRDPHPEDASTAGRHVTLPASAAGYERLRGYDTGQIKDRLAPLAGSLGASGSELVDSAIVGAYAQSATSQTPELVFIAFPLHSVPALADEVRSEGTDGAVRKVMSGASVPGAHPVDAGSLGGGMSCGMQGTTGSVVGLCSWVDRSYVALMILQSPDTDDRLDRTFQQLRQAAEHS